MNLIALLYISSSKDTLTEQDLTEILKISQTKNQEAEITGILCTGGGHFIQVLEGPQKAVLASYLRILDDPRHTDTLLIGATPLKERLFAGWSMGHVNVSNEHMRQRRQQLINASRYNDQGKEVTLLNIMRGLINST